MWGEPTATADPTPVGGATLEIRLTLRYMTKRQIDIGPFSLLGRTVAVAQALANPSRLRLAALLADGELCVCQAVAILEQAASTISAHLSELKRAGLVQERREGKLVFHRWSDDKPIRALLKDVVARCAADPVVVEDRAIAARLRKVDVGVLCAASLDLAAVGIRIGSSKTSPDTASARA